MVLNAFKVFVVTCFITLSHFRVHFVPQTACSGITIVWRIA